MSADTFDTADAPALHEALRARGFHSRESATAGKRVILDRTGRVVGLMTANEAWRWVHAGCAMRGAVADVPCFQGCCSGECHLCVGEGEVVP